MVTRVLTLGETMGLVVTPVGEPLHLASSARLRTAGAESTVAIGLSRLGVATCWAGVVGADGFGQRILRDLHAEGVSTDHVRIAEHAPTGVMFREPRTPDLTRVSYHRAGSAGSLLGPADVDAAFDGFQPTVVHLTGITPALSESAEAAVRRAVERATIDGAEVSLDVNHRATLPGRSRAAKVIGDLLPSVDVLFVGDDELHVLTDTRDPEQAAAEMADHGIPEVIVKRGRHGALARCRGVRHTVAAQPVTPVDLVGAGDGFVAGYLAARGEGLADADRLSWGTVAAAFTVGSMGDWEGLPSRAELEAFDASGSTLR